MDKGAHYYRCDFQVHSPRDCNWTGSRPVTDEDRSEYADRFIAACRAKRLDAVAITDHHDVCYFPYIRDAAQRETGEDGKPVPDERRIVVFPGMELTLGVPCQALLLLDAEFPAHLLSSLHTLLAVTQNGHTEAAHVQTVRLDHITSFEQLCERLDQIDYLKGHYILFPNVSEGGNSTVLRSGFAGAYKSMPCVGGYLDGPVTQHGKGNKGILDGRNKEYGFKSLGLFQTSDNRREDFADLGKHSSWVKWAAPTAEALRQACLAKETRICHEPPVLPPLTVSHISVSNSKFLGPIDIDFNPQFNCMIGGRGTGKSTILEYLRWALCDQPPTFTDEDESVGYQAKRAGLIDKTLAPIEGVVTVGFMLDSVAHVVRRHSRTNEVSLKLGAGEFRTCTEDDIRELLPVQAYSQKQLSAVGVRTDELLRFVRTSVKKELGEIADKLAGLKDVIRSIYGQLKRKRELAREIDRDQLELDSLTKRADALRIELSGLTGGDLSALTTHDAHLQEEQCVEQFERDLGTVREMAGDFRKSLDTMPRPMAAGSDTPGADVLKAMKARLDAVVAVAKSHVDALVALLSESNAEVVAYRSLHAQWKAHFDQHCELYEQTKKRAAAHQKQLDQIAEIEGRVKSLRTELAEKRGALAQYGSPEDEYKEALEEWVALCRNRADLLAVKCSELTTLSSERIRAKLRRAVGLDRAKERLTSILLGTKIQRRKVDELCDQVATHDDPLVRWSRVVAELEQLALLPKTEGSRPELPSTPLLSAANFSSAELERLAPKLTVEDWLHISLVELEDIPVFEYRQRDGEYIQFADASAGQQATALLRVLLNQSGPPLVIDQPEEDLDNQVILEIVQEVWQAKKRRQIIFSSHNANIVVNGDADLVISCDYRTAGDHSGGRIKCVGAIDIDDVKKEITTVMEGGRDAFRLRKDKYGF